MLHEAIKEYSAHNPCICIVGACTWTNSGEVFINKGFMYSSNTQRLHPGYVPEVSQDEFSPDVCFLGALFLYTTWGFVCSSS